MAQAASATSAKLSVTRDTQSIQAHLTLDNQPTFRATFVSVSLHRFHAIPGPGSRTLASSSDGHDACSRVSYCKDCRSALYVAETARLILSLSIRLDGYPSNSQTDEGQVLESCTAFYRRILYGNNPSIDDGLSTVPCAECLNWAKRVALRDLDPLFSFVHAGLASCRSLVKYKFLLSSHII